jgi:hypothetical protein
VIRIQSLHKNRNDFKVAKHSTYSFSVNPFDCKHFAYYPPLSSIWFLWVGLEE